MMMVLIGDTYLKTNRNAHFKMVIVLKGRGAGRLRALVQFVWGHNF